MPTKTIEDRVAALENREREQFALDTAQTEQIKTLFESVKTLRNVVYSFCLVMLLALIYGALGAHGFNAVTNAAKPTHIIDTQSSLRVHPRHVARAHLWRVAQRTRLLRRTQRREAVAYNV